MGGGYWSAFCRTHKQPRAQGSRVHRWFIRKRRRVAQDFVHRAQDGIIQPVALIFLQGRIQLPARMIQVGLKQCD